jgi:hypothetical protein
VVKMIGREENRLEKTFIPAVRQDIQPYLIWLRLPQDGGKGTAAEAGWLW